MDRTAGRLLGLLQEGARRLALDVLETEHAVLVEPPEGDQRDFLVLADARGEPFDQLGIAARRPHDLADVLDQLLALNLDLLESVHLQRDIAHQALTEHRKTEGVRLHVDTLAHQRQQDLVRERQIATRQADETMDAADAHRERNMLLEIQRSRRQQFQRIELIGLEPIPLFLGHRRDHPACARQIHDALEEAIDDRGVFGRHRDLQRVQKWLVRCAVKACDVVRRIHHSPLNRSIPSGIARPIRTQLLNTTRLRTAAQLAGAAI